ncbi:MAG: hypothetical protein WCL39_07225, partial [Armatimonadota bacterium]
VLIPLRISSRVDVQCNQSVYAQGALATDSQNNRYIANGTLRVFVDPQGKIFTAPLPVLFALSCTTIEAPPAPVTQSRQAASHVSTLPGPQTLESGCTGITIGEAKGLADDADVTLCDKVVTRIFSDDFYIEESSRAAGIRVKKNGLLSTEATLGSVVTINGRIKTTTTGERYTDPATSEIGPGISITSSTPPLKPVFVRNMYVGGDSFPSEEEPHQVGARVPAGLNNVGLLVRVAGTVIRISSNQYVLDDGSSAGNESGALTIIEEGDTGLIPGLGEMVTVTGVVAFATVFKLDGVTEETTTVIRTQSHSGTSVSDAIALPLGTRVHLSGSQIKATSDCTSASTMMAADQSVGKVFYIQDTSPPVKALQVRYSGSSQIVVGQSPDIVGTLLEEPDTHEQYLDASTMTASTTEVHAVVPRLTSLNSSSFDAVPMGTLIAAGASDFGAVAGEVTTMDTSSPPRYFKLRDLSTGTSYKVSWEWGTTDGNTIVPPGVAEQGVDGKRVVVYGIRSAEKVSGVIVPVIRVRLQADIKRLVKTYVAIGNGITHAGPADGIIDSISTNWTGKDWGMNASSQAMDYVHLIHRYLNDANPECTVSDTARLSRNGDRLGRLLCYVKSSNPHKTYLETYLSAAPDYVTLQIGENDKPPVAGTNKPYQGVWANDDSGAGTKDYYLFDVVGWPSGTGSYYECKSTYSASSTSSSPDTDTVHWKLATVQSTSIPYTQADVEAFWLDYDATYRQVVGAIKGAPSKPRLFCFGVWDPGSLSTDPCNVNYGTGSTSARKEQIMAAACQDSGVPFTSLSTIACPAARFPGTTGSQAQIDWHPNDTGMKGYFDLFKQSVASSVFGSGAPEAFCLDKITIQVEWDSALGKVDVERRQTWPVNETAYTVIAAGVTAGTNEKTTYIDSSDSTKPYVDAINGATEDTRYVYRVRPWNTGVVSGTYETETYKDIFAGGLKFASIGPASIADPRLVLYAGSSTNGLYASVTEGASWQFVHAFFFKNLGTIPLYVKATFVDRDGYVYVSASSGDTPECIGGVPVQPLDTQGDGYIYRSATPPVIINGQVQPLDFTPVLGENGQSLVLHDDARILAGLTGSSSQWYHSWGFDQADDGSLIVGCSSQETATCNESVPYNNGYVYVSPNNSQSNPKALPVFVKLHPSFLNNVNIRHMHAVLFDPLHGQNGTWFITYGDNIKRMASSVDGGSSFQEVPHWRYGPFPDSETDYWKNKLGGYIGFAVGQNAILAGTDNSPMIPGSGSGYDRFNGNSVLRSEDPLRSGSDDDYRANIVLAFNSAEDAHANGLKASINGEVWLSMMDNYWPSDTAHCTPNHIRDSTVWISVDDGRSWRKIAHGKHALAHDSNNILPVRGFWHIAGGIHGRILGNYIFVQGDSFHIYRFRRFNPQLN